MLNQLISFSIIVLQAPAMERAHEEPATPLLSGPFFLGLVLGIVIGVLAALVFKKSGGKVESAPKFVPDSNPSPPKPIEQTVKSVGQQIRRCPKCDSTYTDESLLYCVSDGTTLVYIGNRPQAPDPNATVLYPHTRKTD